MKRGAYARWPAMGGLTRTERLAVAAIAAATVAAGIARYAGWAPVLAFALAAVALAGLAHVVSLATEQVGERFGPAATGVLQSTLGNLPELFVVIFALRSGQVVVAQTSIVGSLLANGLLVLGLVIVLGARRAPDGVMRFRKRLPNDTATLMLVTSFIIVLVGVAHVTGQPAARHERTISAVAAVALLGVYLAWVVPYVRGESAENPRNETRPRVALAVSIALLTAGGAGSAFVSDWFVAALKPTIASLGVSPAFAGLVVVALAGNAVENVAGLVLAHKQRSDLAISVVKNSVAQVGAFLYPVLVLISLLFAHQLTFALSPVLIAALLLTALAMWQITGDGEAVAFEGWALVALYVILAVFTLYD
ncbi:MAG: Ca2+:H+ antiporter [Solirubrobacteraceae bacterium]|jgi:Ca2+:H+ antiporter|nr:Ca2+:H+ antiporter [Solirubrobacteraceae bacterium]